MGVTNKIKMQCFFWLIGFKEGAKKTEGLSLREVRPESFFLEEKFNCVAKQVNLQTDIAILLIHCPPPSNFFWESFSSFILCYFLKFNRGN